AHRHDRLWAEGRPAEGHRGGLRLLLRQAHRSEPAAARDRARPRAARDGFAVEILVSAKLTVVGPGAKAPQARLRILIADDDRDTASMLAAILRDEGHETHTVLRGDEVLEIDRLVRPDVVILDVNMPGMSGFAVAREIRARRGIAAPLLVAISGKWTRKEDQELGEGVGFEHYLLKPCEPRQLIELLNEFQQRGHGKTTAA